MYYDYLTAREIDYAIMALARYVRRSRGNGSIRSQKVDELKPLLNDYKNIIPKFNDGYATMQDVARIEDIETRLLDIWPTIDERHLGRCLKQNNTPTKIFIRLLDWNGEGMPPKWKGGGLANNPTVDAYKKYINGTPVNDIPEFNKLRNRWGRWNFPKPLLSERRLNGLKTSKRDLVEKAHRMALEGYSNKEISLACKERFGNIYSWANKIGIKWPGLKERMIAIENRKDEVYENLQHFQMARRGWDQD